MSAERKTARLIPVLDVMNGRVVRGVGGRRDEYQPTYCRLSGSEQASHIADGLLRLGCATELYVADLDAIRGKSANTRQIAEILKYCNVPVWLDAGIGRTEASNFPTAPLIRPVVGLETAGSPSVLTRTVAGVSAPVAFSLDLRDGILMGDWSGWGATHERDAIAVVRTAVRAGAKALIVLDLIRVGTGTGTGTEPLLRAIRAEFPDVDLIAGGGVRTWADVDSLGEAGATGVLVASALHDQTLKFPRPTSEVHRP